MSKILIVIDMQNDFITGSLGTPEARAIVTNVKRKIKECKEAGYEIYFTRDSHWKDYLKTFEGQHLPVEHCIWNTPGWQITQELFESFYLNDDYDVINKSTFGYISWEYYLPEETDVEEIQICGLCTDICVISNALILRTLYPDAEIVCDASCCAGTTPEMHEKALDVMKSCQIEVINE